MKLEVGMYVRTKDYGIKEISEIFCDNPTKIIVGIIYMGVPTLIDIIGCKTDAQVINLLEEGDYVNSRRVEGVIYAERINEKLIYFNYSEYIKSEQINTVVTREEFQRYEYHVKPKQKVITHK